jgi:long-chain acyl-CoA synthetase
MPQGTRCAVLAANSPRWLAVYLGIIGCGNTAVPLDTAFHADQVTKLLADCGASYLFVDERNYAVAAEAVAGSNIRLALIDGNHDSLPTFEQMLAAGSEGFEPIIAKAEDLACLLYTSGTTSDPKGVMLTHGNMTGEIDSAFAFIDINHGDAILGVLPLFHSLAQMVNIYFPLGCGAKVVFLDSLSSQELLYALREHGITIFCCVPQFFYLIHERIYSEVAKKGAATRAIFKLMLLISRISRSVGMNPGKVMFAKVHNLLGTKMRYLVTGGSRFDPAIGRDFHALGFVLLQAYGLTETTSGCFCTPPNDNVIGSIGRPLPGVEGKLLNPKKAPDGSGPLIGEILVRGPQVMKGYYNRPDATAEVMKDGWFHTGDLAYQDRKGNYFIAGRAKEMIVLSSGKNIYPEEIEAYYLKSPWIKEICVMGLESTKPGEPLSERLHAVIVPDFDQLRQKKIVNAREVIRYDIESINVNLAATKRILSFDIWQEDLPRTTTKKLRRFEIQQKVTSMKARQSDEAEQTKARTLNDEEREWLSNEQVQRGLAVILKSLKTPPKQIHPQDNLELDLGLDSMERVELLVELEHHLGADVDDTAASEVYTVRELIDLVRSKIGQSAGQGAGWDTILATESTDPEVLAIKKRRFVTDRMWFLFGKSVTIMSRIFFRLKIEGREKLPAGPFILCPNHASYLDAPILTAAMPWRIFPKLFYVGTSEIFGSGPMRSLARFLRLIPVDPDANLVPAMRAGAYGLRNDKILVLYPEGERSIDGTPRTFRKGAAILARHLNVPIVPVAQEGFFEVWPRGRSFQKLNQLKIKIGDPIYPDPQEAPEKAYERMTDELRERVVEMWNELRGIKESPSANSAAAGTK